MPRIDAVQKGSLHENIVFCKNCVDVINALDSALPPGDHLQQHGNAALCDVAGPSFILPPIQTTSILKGHSKRRSNIGHSGLSRAAWTQGSLNHWRGYFTKFEQTLQKIASDNEHSATNPSTSSDLRGRILFNFFCDSPMVKYGLVEDSGVPISPRNCAQSASDGSVSASIGSEWIGAGCCNANRSKVLNSKLLFQGFCFV